MERILHLDVLDGLSPEDPRAVQSRRDLHRVNGWMRPHALTADALLESTAGHVPGPLTELGARDGLFLFKELGGVLLEGHRYAREYREGVVRATGRWVHAVEDGVRWAGLKMHARNVPLLADLEMHLSPRGYIGLPRINESRVNICGLFHQAGEGDGGEKLGREISRGIPGSPLPTG